MTNMKHGFVQRSLRSLCLVRMTAPSHLMYPVIVQNVHYVNDERVVSLKGVPVLVLDFDEDLDLASDEHSKQRYRKMIEAYVGFVRQMMAFVGLQREQDYPRARVKLLTNLPKAPRLFLKLIRAM